MSDLRIAGKPAGMPAPNGAKKQQPDMPVSLEMVVAALEQHSGAAPAPATVDPFETILWENVAYLADDERRAEAFAALRDRVGLEPAAIAAADPRTLREIASIGGIHAELRGERLATVAEIALTGFAGDLSCIRQLRLAEARKALRKFPAIGEPGADKILVFSRAYPLLALDSNGLRVLLRIGFAQETGNYATDYRAVQRALEGSYPADCSWLIGAHMLLRRHGKEICRRTRPECYRCPLCADCPSAARYLTNGSL
jgi:endonuclease III